MLVGIVVKNSNNRFLILKTKVGNQIDLGLVGGEVEKDEILLSIENILKTQTGVDFSKDVEFKTLSMGTDEDGDFLILCCEKDFINELKFHQTEFLWLTFDKIKKLYSEGRLNSDQFYILEKAKYFYQKSKKTNRQAMKVNHLEDKYKKIQEKNNFEDYVERYTDKRLFLRLAHGRKIKPCGRECREYGYRIVKDLNNHSSFENFKELIDDDEFLIKAAEISYNPAECSIFFYDYVNPFLKKNKDFKLQFLKAIYLNVNVYKLEDIKTIVEYCRFEEENEIILSDLEFRKIFEKRIEDLSNQNLEYNCSGESEKELRKYKIKSNELKVLLENKKKGLEEILNTFTVGKKEKLEDDEPQTYYEYLLSQSKPIVII